MLLMVGVLLFLFLLSSLAGKKRGQLTSARMANKWDKVRATHLSFQHLRSCKKKCYPNVLWVGTPQYWWGGKLGSFGAVIQTFLGKSPTVWFPFAGRGILALGIPGSGKTFSLIDRLYESVWRQGFAGLVYDKKGDQLELHASLAARYGYQQINVLAPGYPYSGVLNPLDAVRDCHDTTMAFELGKILNDNRKKGDGKEHDFFSQAGAMVASGLILLAKSSPYPDLAMVYAFLQLPNFVERIYQSVNRPPNHPKKMDLWIAPLFSQMLSSKDAEKTVAGIKATAEATYIAFIQKDLLPCFIGRSNFNLKMNEKELVFFQLDDKRRNVIAPLLAMCIHLCVVENLSSKRKTPFLYGLDELPSLGRLPQIQDYIMEYRSNGGLPILGVQALSQLYTRYGENDGSAIANGLAHHVLFNPGDSKTAEIYSKRYGETEVLVKSQSTGISQGQGSGNRSTNFSEQWQRKPLISVDQILRFPEGRCVITASAYGDNNDGFRPYLLKIPVPPQDEVRARESVEIWHSSIRPQLEQRTKENLRDLDLDNAIEKRIQMAYSMLPLPEEPDFDRITSDSPLGIDLQNKMAALDFKTDD